MLEDKEKGFYTETAIGASKLSGCLPRQGALLIQDRRILAHGYNKKIITGEEWEMSAIYDAVFASRNEKLEGTTLFTTYFPTIEDLKLIVAVGITSLYFMGNINDAKAVKLLNNLKSESIPLEITQLY
jgi:deoxycytidylate deaminase